MDVMQYGLIGHPLGHSVSSRIHQALYEYYGMECSYLHLDTPPEGLPEVIKRLRAEFFGFNVTVPYKQAVLPYLDEVRGDARLFDAVNTVLVQDGRLIGYNTDGTGFLRLLARHEIPVAGARVAVLGAGGAGGVLAQKLAASKIGSLTLLNRSLPKAQAVAERIRANCSVQVDLLTRADRYLPECDLLVQATSVGMLPEVDCSPVPSLEGLSPRAAVVDIIYNPAKTKLLQMAEARGCTAVNGLEMLIYQAFDAFEIWTNHCPPEELAQQLKQSLAGVGIEKPKG